MFIDESLIDFENVPNGQFREGDVIGVGIASGPNSLLQCFATCNGEWIGKIIEMSKILK